MRRSSGHARPLINLFARFVKLRPVTVTLIATNAFYDRVKSELARSFDADEEELAARIRSVPNSGHTLIFPSVNVIYRVIAIGDIEFFFSPEGDEHFKTAWKSIIAEEELVCTKTGTRHAPLPKPKAIIIDVRTVVPPTCYMGLTFNVSSLPSSPSTRSRLLVETP